MSKNNNNKILQATDNLVSGESFSIYWDPDRQRGFTAVEHLDSLDNYYESSDYISHNPSPNSLISQLYLLARGFMLTFKYLLLKKHLVPKSHLLDIGCGTGSFLAFMKKKGFKVTGIESNLKARTICLERNLDVRSNDAGLPHESFDTISLWHVLEHLPKPEICIEAYKDLLKPKGLLVVAVPNFASHDSIHYQQDWAALDVPRHLWHFTTKGLTKMIHDSGFELMKKKALPLDVFYTCYLSEKHLGKSFSLLRGIIKGAWFSLKSLFTGEHSSLVYVFSKRSL